MQKSASNLSDRLALKARLPRTWPAFFERHGNFTAVQVAVIPAVLDGQNVIVGAATASGKTEAVVAPLIERYCSPDRSHRGLQILYITPTKALVNDIAARLGPPLESLGLSRGVRTYDVSTFRPKRPANLLITTPESADSLLASSPQLFTGLRAIVIDELHLFDGTPRGDQLRVILNRIRRIRAFAAEHGDAPDATLQYAALSATLAEPEAIAARYFDAAQVIQVPGKRAIESELIPMASDSSAELIDYLAMFRAKGWRKALVFCNSRAEVEAYAAAARINSPFGESVYVHYSNIEPKRRREIERQFAETPTALCFASSTLELGIDVGAIDVVILVGPPGAPHSFVQRVGRGNRRRQVTRVACFYRSSLEQLLFQALLDERQMAANQRPCFVQPFHPAVAIQQIFSLIKQSPTAAVRLTGLADLFEGMLSSDDLQAILGQLQHLDYLRIGRPGEWRAGERLNKLYDEQLMARSQLSIYSNVQTSAARTIGIRDQHTHEIIATVDALWLDRDILTLEGRPVNVNWVDGEVMWVASYQGQEMADQLIYRSTRQLLSYELARLLPSQLGLPLGTAPFIAASEGWYWFHWLGDLYGRATLDLLRYRVAATETEHIGLCLHLPDEPQALPAWTEEQVIRYLQDNYRTFEPLLALGPFHHLLPTKMRRRAVVEQFNVPQFLDAVATLRPMSAPPSLAEDLIRLIEV